MIDFDEIVDFESFDDSLKKDLDKSKPEIMDLVEKIHSSSNPPGLHEVTHAELSGDKYFAELENFVIYFLWTKNNGVNQLEIKPKYH